jgi:radical SAM/Cys-rich protein
MADGLATFAQTLSAHGLELVRGKTHTLQVNVGLLCNLRCRHCHLEAGPHREEIMSLATMEAVLAYTARVAFDTIDVTGGAPELIPHIGHFLTRLAQQSQKLIVRTNLVALHLPAAAGLIDLFQQLQITLVASLPATNASQADSQRGQGVWQQSLEALRALNRVGYGQPGSGLILDLVANPAGAFLPADQAHTEKRYRRDLEKNGIVFSHLFTFANVPLGRFQQWLVQSGNEQNYLRMLVDRFNPGAVCGLMCRSLISVAWDGYLYDCDFNQVVDLHHGATKTHISALQALPPEGTLIPTGEHCYACTAGAGFT